MPPKRKLEDSSTLPPPTSTATSSDPPPPPPVSSLPAPQTKKSKKKKDPINPVSPPPTSSEEDPKSKLVDYKRDSDSKILDYFLSCLPEHAQALPRHQKLQALGSILEATNAVHGLKSIPLKKYDRKELDVKDVLYHSLIFSARDKCAFLSASEITVISLKSKKKLVEYPNEHNLLWVASMANDLLVLASEKQYYLMEIDWASKTMQELPLTANAPKPYMTTAPYYSISEDGKKLLVQKDGGTLIIWDVEREEFLPVKTGFGNGYQNPFKLWATLPGNRLAVANSGGNAMDPPSIRLFSLIDGSQINEIGTRQRYTGCEREPAVLLPLPKSQIFISYKYNFIEYESFIINYETNSTTEFKEKYKFPLKPTGAPVSEREFLLSTSDERLISVDLYEKKLTQILEIEGDQEDEDDYAQLDITEGGVILWKHNTSFTLLIPKE